MSILRALMGLAAAAMLTNLAMAANYTVGGATGGWDITTNLQSWASSKSFLVGDNLIFQYGPSHDVAEVTKADYDSCQTTNALQTDSSGTTIISLASPGKRYFLCGTPGHCGQGMKVEIDTLAASAPPPTSPPAAPPTQLPISPISPASSPSPVHAVDTPTISPVHAPTPTRSPVHAPTPTPTPTRSPVHAPTPSPSEHPLSSPSVHPTESPESSPPASLTSLPPDVTSPPPPSSATKLKMMGGSGMLFGFLIMMVLNH